MWDYMDMGLVVPTYGSKKFTFAYSVPRATWGDTGFGTGFSIGGLTPGNADDLLEF